MDWDQDGKLDILSGCYWTDDADGGYIQMLKGNGSLDFATAIEVTNKAGNPLLNAEIEEADDTAMADNQTQTICTQQHAVDYDGDGDLDLVVGCFGPEFFYYENTGSNKQIELAESPVQLDIQMNANHSAPHLVDWDGDGDLDLLSGSSAGGALFSENTGSRDKPQWSDFQQLIPASNLHQQSTTDGQELKPSASSRIWCYDWNGDGLLDILLGDSATISNPREGVSPEEFERLLAEHEQDMQALQEKNQAVFEEYSKVYQSGEKPSEELMERMTKASEEQMEVYEKRNEFLDETRTGFVWLYIRKSTDQTVE